MIYFLQIIGTLEDFQSDNIMIKHRPCSWDGVLCCSLASSETRKETK